MPYLSRFQAFGLIVLRTLIGWHFLYEGYYKLMLPGWSRTGTPLAPFSAAGYMKGATGPLAPFIRPLADSAAMMGWIDILVPLGLLLVGLSLVLGLFTRLGTSGALGFLTLFYLTAIPMSGVPGPNQEGTYLLVNKNLIEASAVIVLIAFRTGEIAGIDAAWPRRRATVTQPLASRPPAAA